MYVAYETAKLQKVLVFSLVAQHIDGAYCINTLAMASVISLFSLPLNDAACSRTSFVFTVACKHGHRIGIGPKTHRKRKAEIRDTNEKN